MYKLYYLERVFTEFVSFFNRSLSLRVFPDTSTGAMWKRNVKDVEGELLCVSQFTLLANTTKGNKPDFHRAMSTEPSKQMYSSFLARLGSLYDTEKIKGSKNLILSLVHED